MYLLLHNGYIITTLTATHPGGSDIVSLTPQVLDSLIEPVYIHHVMTSIVLYVCVPEGGLAWLSPN